MHSAWIGEHHFNSLGVLSCPDLVLAYIAARTKHIRLAPAVTVHAAASSDPRRRAMGVRSTCSPNGRVDFAAGRGYDSREYAPFHVDFSDNQGIFEEGMEVIQKLWAAEDRISHHGKHYPFDDVRITPKPVQNPMPAYIGSFSKPSIELAAPPRLRPDRRAVRRLHELSAASSRWPTSTTRPASSTARSPAG